MKPYKREIKLRRDTPVYTQWFAGHGNLVMGGTLKFSLGNLPHNQVYLLDVIIEQLKTSLENSL